MLLPFVFPSLPRIATLGTAMANRKLPLSTIRRVALSFPGVEEGTSYGTPAFRLNKRLLARLHQDGQSIMLKIGFEARDHLMRADPQTFFITDHYRNHPSVLARLDRLSAADLRKLLARASRVR
jgi:hypothetical protein